MITLIYTQILSCLHDITGGRSQLHSLILAFNGMSFAEFVFFLYKHLFFLEFQDTFLIGYFRCPDLGYHIN